LLCSLQWKLVTRSSPHSEGKDYRKSLIARRQRSLEAILEIATISYPEYTIFRASKYDLFSGHSNRNDLPSIYFHLSNFL